RVSPSLGDALLLLIGFQFQHTQEPKSENDSSNVYTPVTTDNRVHGDYSGLVVPSVTDWLAKNPELAWGGLAIALGFLVTQAFNPEKRI
ncbi:MAG: hypothetical protein VKJ46_05220, partial [Leptolyngbyaceae bacterium]|nr:hypothetical protein [Leptolyngbyaceae bacterium]